MDYTKIDGIHHRIYMLQEYLKQCDEIGSSAEDKNKIIAEVEKAIENAWDELQKLPGEPEMNELEPSCYDEILKLRPLGSKPAAPILEKLPEDFGDRLKAAILSRFAGCTLGAPVEGWTLEQIDNYAKQLGLTQPLNNYWPDTPCPNDIRYNKSSFLDYTLKKLCEVPCDDDVGFTILALLIAEEGSGHSFTLEEVAKTWLKYVTIAYTAEDAALRNLRNGVPADKAAEYRNPYQELIGADIRCDGYGYMAPGNPELAAKMAYTDAYLTHRRNGIYGSMYFAAVISAAFTTRDPFEAFREGLKYIPADCRLAKDVRWALDICGSVRDYRHAAELVDERYPGMSIVHTLNNACLVIFAFALGKDNVGKIIGNAVAMAHDNDCTAATAGSIAGALFGMKALDEHWYKPFNNKIKSFYNGPEYYEIDDIINRYIKMAEKSFN